MAETQQPFVWCVVANVTREPHVEGRGGNVTEADRVGVKHFAPGAKLYLFPRRWHDGGERMEVLGRHRGAGPKLIRITIATRWLVDFRAKQVFQPHVVREMADWWTEEKARAFVLARSEAVA